MRLTSIELNECLNALRVASEQYTKDAETCRGAGDTRTAEHFEELAKRAIVLADKIEND